MHTLLPALSSTISRCMFAGSLALTASLTTPALAATALAPVDVNSQITPQTPITDNPQSSLQLIAPRGGAASAQIVLKADAPLKTLTASCSEFTSKSGAKLPASAAALKYPTRLPDLGPNNFNNFPWAKSLNPNFDALSDSFIPGESLQPVWITLQIPPDALPDQYTATLSITTPDGLRKIPVQLTVALFQMPKPGSQQMWVSMTQSPDTLAQRYKVTPWSDPHFQLLEQSFHLMSQLGNSVIYVPILTHTAMGEATGLIYFRKKGDQLVPDFTAFDRYLALYTKHCGTPRAVILNVWDPYCSTDKINTTNQLRLSLAKDDGTFEDIALPLYDDAQKTLWKSVYDGALERTTKAGLPKQSLLLGTAADVHPLPKQITFFNDIVSGSTWADFTHGYGGITPSAKYVEKPDGPVSHGRMGTKIPDYFLRGIGAQQMPLTGLINLNTQRDCHDDGAAPWVFRLLHDASIDGPFTGLARVGLDLWAIPASDQESEKQTANRKYSPKLTRCYERYGSNYGRLYRHPTWAVTCAGPTGAIPTARFEALHEGYQQAEARLACEKAILSKKITGPDLQTLRSAVQAICDMEFAPDTTGSKARTSPPPDWQLTVQKLYTAAGLAQQKLNEK